MNSIVSIKDTRSRIANIHGQPLRPAVAAGSMTELAAQLAARHRQRSQDFASTAKLTPHIFAPLHKLVTNDKRAVKALQALRKSTARRVPKRSTTKTTLPDFEPEIRTGSLITILTKPYNYEWTWSAPFDRNGGGVSNVGSAVAYKNYGEVTLFAQNGGTSINVAGGIGTYFRPLAPNTWVEFRPLIQFDYYWRNNSEWGVTAHSGAFLGIYVVSFNLAGGDRRVEWDQRPPLWNDGTSWFQEHSGSDGGYYPVAQSTISRRLSSNRHYIFWVWGNLWCDASGGNSIFRSFSTAKLFFKIPFVAFEQWV